MSTAERAVRDRLRRSWEERHSEWPPTTRREPRPFIPFEDFGARYGWLVPPGEGDSIVIWTTGRMFDGRFWAMEYRWRASRRRYVLVRGSIRRRAKRKDAKAHAEAIRRREV